MHKIFSFLATGTLLLGTLTPAVFADSTFSVSGNGAESQSTVNATADNSSTLVQNNSANVTNTVNSNSNTGGNNADENTGGNVTVDTGNALNATDIQTQANENVAQMTGAGTADGNTTVELGGNGALSQNQAALSSTNTSSLFQTNNANVTNDVQSNAQTGNNNADRNTGGDVLVLTGHAANDTTIRNAVNANVADMGSGTNVSNGGVALGILGNGFNSDNSVNLNQANDSTLVQNNDASITNRVNSNAQTGDNSANENTGGNTTVDTGNALNTTSIDNMANFNSADLSSCGCTLGNLLAKVSGNGALSNNQLDLSRNDTMSVFQGGEDNGNTAQIQNDIQNDNQTGNNNAQRNTGSIFGMIDPVDVVTGHTGSSTQVSNHSGVNMFGPNVQLPGGTDLNFTFDLNGLLGSLHL